MNDGINNNFGNDFQNSTFYLKQRTKKPRGNNNQTTKQSKAKRNFIFNVRNYEEIVVIFHEMVKDTILFEKNALKMEYGMQQKIFPLLNKAKKLLYLYYKKYLYTIDRTSNIYLESLFSYFE
ncbi:hypothetical protein CWI39_0223p0010 [Hamiltosporidium magnivora]|uniref:Uncharacterized protein n=1 Tax=Hamiltosporidium magnivora TaxID=148818 RepID=A0A4Q9LIV8_9MICR|nr:hypothetical protein CWI39_0223p0010 [Hamiltosporidium magnivora]